MSIPQSWYDERSALFAEMHAQAAQTELRRKALDLRAVAQAAGIPVAPDAPSPAAAVSDETIAQLDETPVTDGELALLADARGRYLAGDTRGFVMAHERLCVLQNCWMVRDADGSPRYLSEPVADGAVVARNGPAQ